MFYLKKEVTIAGAHRLDHLDYDSPCRELHGHNWKITVYCKGKKLNRNHMLVDFKDIKTAISNQFDHQCLNDALPIPSTAENLARYICDAIPHCYRVDVEEAPGAIASYEVDDA